jgi:YidC/Oxa1 family membrane protein insertase
VKFFSQIKREIQDYRRLFAIPKENRPIVFYAEDASYHTFFEGVLNELLDHYDLPVCYVSSQMDDPIFMREHHLLKTFYLNHLLGFFTLNVDSAIVVYTMPDLGRLHLKKSVKGANHFYFFHNIGSYFHVIRFGGLFHYDTFFCVGPHQVRELRREQELYQLPQRRLVEFGYHRLDKIYAEYQTWRSTHRTSTKGYRGRILFAPGWGPWEERNSALDLCGERIIRRLLDGKFAVILRPHPMMRIKYPHFLDTLYSKFKNEDAFSAEENISSLESFFNTDLMISDWSGVVYEYAFGTEKPVLFIDSPMKVNNPEYEKFGFDPIDIDIRSDIGKLITLREIDQIESIAYEVINSRAKYKAKIIEARDRCVFNFGSSSKVGAEFVHNYAANVAERSQ